MIVINPNSASSISPKIRRDAAPKNIDTMNAFSFTQVLPIGHEQVASRKSQVASVPTTKAVGAGRAELLCLALRVST